jgi:transposase-like protein
MIVAAPHPPEFRRRAVELARRGDRPISLLAARLQISESCLRSWVNQADIDENGSEFRLTSVEKQELAQLRKEKRRLQTENEILKRAVAYLAQKNYSAADDPDSVEVDAASCFSFIRARAAAAGEYAPAVRAGRTTRRVPS